MELRQEEVKRAIRTAKRSLEAANIDGLADEADRHIAEAVQQLTFALERLLEKEPQGI
jgi:hypothetical protein